MLEFTEVEFSYGDSPEPAVRGVSLTLEPGERVALVGANGSGKSTIARLANATLVPMGGSVTVDGIGTSAKAQSRAIRSLVGMVGQDSDAQIVSSTVESEVSFGPENLGIGREEIAERARSALAAVGLTGKEPRDPNTLSGGERQRLVIAGALAMKPRYLVLDEPCAMLDGAGRKEVLEAIGVAQQAGCGILQITHSLAECLAASRVLVLADGSIVFEGKPLELLGDERLLTGSGLVREPILEIARHLSAAGVELPADPSNPSQLAYAVVRHWEA